MSKSSALTFLDAAELVLREHRAALTADDIIRLALDRGELRTRGATPETAMRARLSTDIVEDGPASRFPRVGPNRFACVNGNAPSMNVRHSVKMSGLHV